MDRNRLKEIAHRVAAMHPHQPGVPLINPNPRGDASQRRRLEDVIGMRAPSKGSVKTLSKEDFQSLLDHTKGAMKGLSDDLKRLEPKLEASKKAAESAVAKYHDLKERYDAFVADARAASEYYYSHLRSRESRP